MKQTDALAVETADLAIATHKRLDRQGRELAKLADVEGERIRAATLAARFEGWATARVSPRRRRSEKIAAFDVRVAELEGRMGELMQAMTAIRDRLPHADAEYREALRRFHAEGKGERPVSPLPALENELRELQDDYGAHEALVGEVLREKTKYVEVHRNALRRNAARERQEARDAYAAAIDHLVEAREDLIAARRDELFFALYPDASVAAEPPATALVGGIVARLRAAVPGLQVSIGMPELRRLLAADADFVSAMRTPEQERLLREREPELVNMRRDAVWAQTDEGQKALAQERREALESYRREWGLYPA